MQNPDEIPYVRRRLDMATVLVPELQSVLQAIFQCADSGQPLNLTTLQQLLDPRFALPAAAGVPRDLAVCAITGPAAQA